MNLERADRRRRSVYKGQDITKLSPGRALKAVRRNIQMVFQDPYTSLNPRMTVGDIIGEPFDIHPEVAPEGRPAPQGPGAPRRRRSEPGVHQPVPAPVLRRPAPAHRHRPRPRAPTRRSSSADEPVSALDVSVQAQVINLLEQASRTSSTCPTSSSRTTCRSSGTSPTVSASCTSARWPRSARTSRSTTTRRTRTPRRCSPRCRCPDPEARAHRERIILTGDVPSPANPPSGCRFRTRCWKAQETLLAGGPGSRGPAALPGSWTARPPHDSACHFAEEKQVVHAA
ncbi:dipeptide ABC transporter ATP-binding protein [Streptomyces tanashiensis]